jgi:hypothetical protein
MNMEYSNQPTQPMSVRTRAARRLTETKQAFKTTEFWIYIVAVLAILIAGLVAEGGSESVATQDAGSDDGFGADKVWLYITALTIGYMISRGLAKAGSHDPYTDQPDSEHGSTESIGDRVKAAAQVLKEGESGTGSTGTHPATGAAQPERRNY